MCVADFSSSTAMVKSCVLSMIVCGNASLLFDNENSFFTLFPGFWGYQWLKAMSHVGNGGCVLISISSH